MASGKAIITNIKATYSMIVSYFCEHILGSCCRILRQLHFWVHSGASTGSISPKAIRNNRATWATSCDAEGTIPPDAVRQRNCQPRLPAGEPDTRFPAVYSGLFPCSEGVGGSAHRNPRARNCLSPWSVPFEICEYGRQPKPEKIKVLFPFIP